MKDNHDLWGMCKRTIITAVLTVISGMDPHMIGVTWVGMVEALGVGQSCV
jgi:hypothetical protein